MVNSLYIFNSDTLRQKAATRNKVCRFPDLQQRYLQNLGGAYNVQATASHDDNTDNNDNYVEDDIDKKFHRNGSRPSIGSKKIIPKLFYTPPPPQKIK